MAIKKTKEFLVSHPNFLVATLFIAMGIILSTILAAFQTQPNFGTISSNQFEQDKIRGIICAVGLAGLLSYIGLRRRMNTGLRWLFKVSAVALVIVASVAYFYTTRSLTRRHYLNFHDSFHYFLGCKYIEETGYTQFYNCFFKALKERDNPKYKPNSTVRNLENYRFYRASTAIKNADCSQFTPKRWEEFKTDSTFFATYLFDGATKDHGYNGTPLSAAVFGFFANLPKVTYKNMVYITFFDLFGLSILFAVFTWGFGWKAGLLAALFHFVNFGDYYYHASFFRYWWWLTLGSGIACLHKQKYGLAAACLVASAMLNVFPFLFLAALGVKIMYTIIRTRQLRPNYQTFLTWAVAATIIFGGLSLASKNPVERYQSFFDNMDQHSGLLTGTRTGFRYNFLYQGMTRDAFKRNPVNIKAQYRRLKPVINTMVIALLALFTLLIIRLDDAQAAIVGGFALLFLLFSTVRYYYALAPLLLLLWSKDLRKTSELLLCALLFALMTVVHASWWQTSFSPFTTNTVLSGAFTLYLGVIFVVLGIRSGLFSAVSSIFRRRVSI